MQKKKKRMIQQGFDNYVFFQMHSQMCFCSLSNHLQNNLGRILPWKMFSGFMSYLVSLAKLLFWIALRSCSLFLSFAKFLSEVVKFFSLLSVATFRTFQMNKYISLDQLFSRKTYLLFFCFSSVLLYLEDYMLNRLWHDVLNTISFWDYPKFDSLVWRQLLFYVDLLSISL